MRSILAIIASLFALGSVIDAAQEANAVTVHGTLRMTGGGAELPEIVRVTLEASGIPLREVFAVNSRFQFTNVSPGWYTLNVTGGQFEDIHVPIVLPAESEVVLTIRRKPDSTSSSIAPASVFELQVPKQARREFRNAQAALRKQDCRAALARLDKALAMYSQYPEAHNSAGICYAKLGESARAEDSFKKAMEFTTAVYPSLNLADLMIQQGRFADAEAVLTRAIARNPADGMGYYGLAALRLQQNRLEEAEQLALSAQTSGAPSPDLHLMLAKIHQRQGKTDLLVRDLNAYLKKAKPGELRKRIERTLLELMRTR